MRPLFSADCTTIKLCKLPLSFPGPELHQTHTNNSFCISCACGNPIPGVTSLWTPVVSAQWISGLGKSRGKGRRKKGNRKGRKDHVEKGGEQMVVGEPLVLLQLRCFCVSPPQPVTLSFSSWVAQPGWAREHPQLSGNQLLFTELVLGKTNSLFSCKSIV